MAEANSILDEMAHDQSMAAIRGFAYALIKVFKALFNRVYVNEDGVQRVSVLVSSWGSKDLFLFILSLINSLGV